MPYADPVMAAAYFKQYREADRDRRRAQDREWKRRNAHKVKAYHAEWMSRHPEHRRKYTLRYKEDGRTRSAQLKSRYGISVSDHAALLEAQGHNCAVCGEPFGSRRVVVDHCHKMGRVRGLVHIECNVLLGCADDRPEILERAIEYLHKWSTA